MTALGAILLTGAGLLAGILGVRSIREQVERAEALARLVELMRLELSRFRTPLPTLFRSLSDRTEGIASELCRRAAAAREAEDGPFAGAWDYACACLAPRERGILLPLGQILGRYGAEEQAGAMETVLEELRRYGAGLRERQRDKSRLWLGLSMACGLLAAVLLW